jgi:hypothetical protein
LKAPGTKLLRLEYDEQLSDFAFKFNLRRYNQEMLGDYHAALTMIKLLVFLLFMVGLGFRA